MDASKSFYQFVIKTIDPGSHFLQIYGISYFISIYCCHLTLKQIENLIHLHFDSHSNYVLAIQPCADVHILPGRSKF